MTDYYYLLESGELAQSKWEKQVGEVHRDSKIKFVLNREQFVAMNKAIAKEQARLKRASKKEVDLWLAKLILQSAQNVGVDVPVAIDCMKQFAPGSFNALKSIIK